MINKTIDDLTKEDIVALVDAAFDLLSSHRLLCWENGEEEKDDQSHIEAGAKMAAALESIGLPQLSYGEFCANVQHMIDSALPPDEWREKYFGTLK